MSNGILYDTLLTSHLAEELNHRLRGRGCGAAPTFARDMSVTLPLDRGEVLRMDLHPTRGWIRIIEAPTGSRNGTEGICAGVHAPRDERLISFLIDVEDRVRVRRRTLTLELPTNQWNAILHEEGRIVSVLRSRMGGARPFCPGEDYHHPPARFRIGAGGIAPAEALACWRSSIADLAPGDRRAVALSEFANVSAINVDWILEPYNRFDPTLTGDRSTEMAFARWWSLLETGRGEPCVLLLPRGLQPYPAALQGVPSNPAPSLLEAMARVATARAESPTEPNLIEAEAVVERGTISAIRKLERLRAELAAAGEAERMRAWGDLLLANLHRIERGRTSIELDDWDGKPVTIPLDATLAPAENATRYYDEARRKGRAEEQLPGLIDKAKREVERWMAAAEGIASGHVPEWIARLEEDRRGRAGKATSPESSIPYRIFRTSGGLEVRVGRSSRDNDRLTFRESAPNDVWLHAQAVPGSHVILRWPHPDASPPARDLGEAAQLAAVFSRARTSSTVAVDWTRRKHVRKPRGSAPGLVIPQRVRTLFVSPDPDVVERLAAPGSTDEEA